MNTPEETLDMMRDEFARIAADTTANDHIKWLCQRAMMEITCRTPLIVQRDRAERELALTRTAILDALTFMGNTYDVIGTPMINTESAKRLIKALPSYQQPHGMPVIKESLSTED